jgi:hypothetical protein
VRLKIVQRQYYSQEHLERRKAFYGVEDPTNVALEDMVNAYKSLSLINGFEFKWWLLIDRIFMYRVQRHSADRACFLILALQKNNTEA